MTKEVTRLERLRLQQEPPIRNNAELARAVGIDKSQITRLEQGAAGELTRRRVAEYFGMSLESFDAHLEGDAKKEAA